MRKRVFLAALLAVMVLAVGCTNGGYVPTSLAGYVYVETSGSSAVISPSPTPPAGYQPLDGAYVWLTTQSSIGATTRYDGQFFFPGVNQGAHIINVSSDGLPWETMKTAWTVRTGTNWVHSELFPGLGFYVIIGISNYKYLEDTPGPRQDAQLVQQTLFRDNQLAGIGFTLLDSQATKRNIRNRIERAIDFADSNDFLVVYFSGYSGQDYLSPYDDDGEAWATAITDWELEQWLGDFPGDVTVIIDGSESSTMADGNVFKPFALEEDSKYTVIAAARKGESAVYDPDLGNSVFTYFLVEGLEIQVGYARSDSNGDRDVSANEIYDYVFDTMRKYYENWTDPKSHKPYIKEGAFADAVIFRY